MKELENLDNFLIEDILEMTKEEILEESIDIDADSVRSIFQSVLDKQGFKND